MTILDPLGNTFYEGFDIEEMVNALLKRVFFLKQMHRMGSVKVGQIDMPELDPTFLECVKDYAETFHNLIQAQTTRFLGNCSTRCMRGFPSERIGDLIYVSKRNVDKRYIDKDAFVPCKLEDGKVHYYNDNKPSVDTPIQLSLYEKLPNINYMIHSHCYIKDAPFTEQVVPCGALQEINDLIVNFNQNYLIILNDLNKISRVCQIRVRNRKRESRKAGSQTIFYSSRCISMILYACGYWLLAVGREEQPLSAVS